ncbi:MAG: amidohydrolase family protein, partial [Sphingomonadales bacterium]|nr:amidohydrolase family protein [Sphingomonadales bacterium]
MPQVLHAGSALLPQGWVDDVRITIAGGRITGIETSVAPQPEDERAALLMPGLCNLHSHAFQRAIAGRGEVRGVGEDSFWSWREAMYRFVPRLDPEAMRAIAALAYVEMLEGGFTRVGEFHYLHNAPDGSRYADPAAMARALAESAQESGIGMTLLPVFYAHAGFGGQAPQADQARFLSTLDSFTQLHGACAEALRDLPGAVLGLAPHSLRAVTPEELAGLVALAGTAPIHIHIAEQVREVEQCLAW